MAMKNTAIYGTATVGLLANFETIKPRRIRVGEVMAMCDYRQCDICGGKAFYDANLNYDDEGNFPDYVGDWCVICDECAKTHKCVVMKKETP